MRLVWYRGLIEIEQLQDLRQLWAYEIPFSYLIALRLCRKVKVSLSRNVFLVSLILPKNERKQLDLMYHSCKIELFCSFVGELKIPMIF